MKKKQATLLSKSSLEKIVTHNKIVRIISDKVLEEICKKSNNIVLKWRTNVITSLGFSNSHFTMTHTQ